MSTALVDKPDVGVGRARFRRVVQIRPYEVAEANVEVEFYYDPDDVTNAAQQGRDAMTECKSLVYTELGLPMEVHEGVVTEIIKDAFNATEVIDLNATSVADNQVSEAPSAATPPYDPKPLQKPKRQMNDIEKQQDKANREWATARWESHPQEFYDNRPDKNNGGNPRLPDVKHKDSGIGIWFD